MLKLPTRIITIISLTILLSLFSLSSTCWAWVKVAILDSGCNIEYEEGISFISETVRDDNGHGTLIAMVIKEISPEARLYIVKVVGKDGFCLDEDAVINGLQWAIAKDVDIINLSLRIRESKRLHQVIQRAYEKGITLVAATGNKATFSNSLVRHESGYYYKGGIGAKGVVYPARYEEVIAVGRTNSYERLADYLLKGEEVEIVFPGYKNGAKGTSIACAQATGIISLVKLKYPNLSPDEIRNMMHQSMKELCKKGKDGFYGYSLLMHLR